MKRILITAVISLVVGIVLGLFAGRRLPPTREQVANYLSNLSVGELSDFTKRLSQQWGFQAFPQNFLPGGNSGQTMPAVPQEAR